MDVYPPVPHWNIYNNTLFCLPVMIYFSVHRVVAPSSESELFVIVIVQAIDFPGKKRIFMMNKTTSGIIRDIF